MPVQWQRLQPDKIYIGVPPMATRLGEPYEVPPALLADGMVEVVHLPIDFGPISKLAAALYAEQDADACIIT